MSLASKLFWNILLVLAAVLGVTGWLSIQDERLALQTVHAKHGSAMAHSLAAFSVEAMVSKDYPSLETALHTIGRGTDNVVHLSITRDGNTVASFGKPGNGESFSSPIQYGAGTDEPRTIGEARVILSAKDGEAIIASRINELLLNSLLLFITLAIALNFLTRRLVIRRLWSLTKATEGVIADTLADPDATAVASKGDEIEHLKGRYRAMMKGLERREQERSQAVDRLQEARALLDDLANSLPSALIVLSQDQKIVYCNLAALELAGYNADPALPDTLPARFPLQSADLEPLASVTDQTQPQERHRQYWSSPSGQKIVNLAAYPLSTRAAGGVVIRIDDVTSRTRLEEAMIQSEKLMSIGGLAAGVAHEINNPLGVMIQAAQNIERRVSEDLPANHKVAAGLGIDVATVRAYLEQRSILEFLNDIKADGARAAKIVRSLLEFSRKSEPVLAPTNLAELVDHAIDLARKDYDLKKKFDFRKIAIALDLAPNLPEIPMIRSEIEQVLINLLKNSAQAMSEKFTDEQNALWRNQKPQINISARHQDDKLTIAIEDNGPGFSEEAQRRAFEPFFTTKAPGVGTGLGLWISYTIVTDKHRGEMRLESTPGEGTRFIIQLPA